VNLYVTASSFRSLNREAELEIKKLTSPRMTIAVVLTEAYESHEETGADFILPDDIGFFRLRDSEG
jgi:hypothetical protein